MLDSHGRSRTRYFCLSACMFEAVLKPYFSKKIPPKNVDVFSLNLEKYCICPLELQQSSKKCVYMLVCQKVEVSEYGDSSFILSALPSLSFGLYCKA